MNNSLRMTIPTLLVALLLAPMLAIGGILPCFHTAIFGGHASQTLRVSVLNAGSESMGILPCVHLIDGDGHLLAELPLRHPPEPGRASSVYLDLAGVLDRQAVRPAELWVEVDLSGHEAYRGDPGLLEQLQASVELFETSTGVTRGSLPLYPAASRGAAR